MRFKITTKSRNYADKIKKKRKKKLKDNVFLNEKKIFSFFYFIQF
jgi:hypothetical protein